MTLVERLLIFTLIPSLLTVCAYLANELHLQAGYGPNDVSAWGALAVACLIAAPLSLFHLVKLEG